MRACSFPREPVPSTATLRRGWLVVGCRLAVGTTARVCHRQPPTDNAQLTIHSTFHLEPGSQTPYIEFVQIVSYIAVVTGAYFLGSIPTGYLVARATGIDIRTVGSGNLGATNVIRILGK